MIVPSSNIILLKTPFELDNKNNLTFNNIQAQLSYFNSLPHTEITDATYQRKEGVIRYPSLIDSIMSYNYCMYQNENFSNKWFFAFITNMEFVNNNVTNISIETDVWQTYMFDITFRNSFVEREHVNNDSIGLVLFDEVFDKMDDRRMKSMMKFIASMPVQILLACPSSRLKDLAPYTDTIIVTLRDGEKAQIVNVLSSDVFDGKYYAG